MKYRVLGKDLRVSAVGLGCMGFSHAYGRPTAKEDAVKALRAAADMGYTFFDTAECYGPYENEELLKAAFGGNKEIAIATKFGVTLRPGSPSPIPDSRPDIIRKSVEGSLKRLGVERIDLYYQHRIDPDVEPETVAGVMSELMAEGKIARWGISETDADYLRRAHAVCPVTAIQNRYSMMYRDYEELFPLLEELGVGFVAFSPLANGLLSDRYDRDSEFEKGVDYRADMPQFKAGAYDENVGLLSLLRTLAAEKNATPAQISLAWMLCKKPYIVPIPGTRRPERMRENAAAADIPLTEDEVESIDRELARVGMSAVFGGHASKKR